MFERELAFFIGHQEELVRAHLGRTLIIRGDEIEGIFDTPLQAYLHARKHLEPGSFMIQECVPGPEAYTVTINSSALTLA